MEWINSKQTFPISRVDSRPICPVSCDPEQPSVDFLPRKVSLRSAKSVDRHQGYIQSALETCATSF